MHPPIFSVRTAFQTPNRRKGDGTHALGNEQHPQGREQARKTGLQGSGADCGEAQTRRHPGPGNIRSADAEEADQVSLPPGGGRGGGGGEQLAGAACPAHSSHLSLRPHCALPREARGVV